MRMAKRMLSPLVSSMSRPNYGCSIAIVYLGLQEGSHHLVRVGFMRLYRKGFEGVSIRDQLADGGFELLVAECMATYTFELIVA